MPDGLDPRDFSELLSEKLNEIDRNLYFAELPECERRGPVYENINPLCVNNKSTYIAPESVNTTYACINPGYQNYQNINPVSGNIDSGYAAINPTHNIGENVDPVSSKSNLEDIPTYFRCAKNEQNEHTPQMSVASNDTFSTNESFTFTTNDPNIQII
jgi:hypothetical protein